jgi:hypothetical protein
LSSFQSWLLVWLGGVFTIIFTNSKAASWRNQLFQEETNLFANSKDLNDMKTTFKIKRIHDSYLGLKILGKQWLHLLNYIHHISWFFKLQRKKLGQKNGSFLLLIVKLLDIYAGSCPGSTGSPGLWVAPPSRLGFTGFFLLPVFCLTRTGSTIELIGSRVNPPGRFEFNNTGFNSWIVAICPLEQVLRVYLPHIIMYFLLYNVLPPLNENHVLYISLQMNF